MEKELYPQKWLPYRYVGCVLWNHWDSIRRLRRVGVCLGTSFPFDSINSPHNISGRQWSVVIHSTNGVRLPKVLILQAGKDELVPAGLALNFDSLCKRLSMDVKRVLVKDALHANVITKCTGRSAVVAFLKDNGHG